MADFWLLNEMFRVKDPQFLNLGISIRAGDWHDDDPLRFLEILWGIEIEMLKRIVKWYDLPYMFVFISFETLLFWSWIFISN